MPKPKQFRARLVTDRYDFIVIYLSSLATAIFLLVGATIVQSSDVFLLVGAILALLPPAIAVLVPSGRRVVHVLFGALLLPIVGVTAINSWASSSALGR